MDIIHLTKQGHRLEIWDDDAGWVVDVMNEENETIEVLGPYLSEDEAFQEGRRYFHQNIATQLEGKVPLVRYRIPNNMWDSEDDRIEGYSYHEAGHAVLYHLSGRRVTLTTIDTQATDLPGWSDGQTKSEPGDNDIFLDDTEPNLTPEIKKLKTEIGCTMAGFAAESLAFGWNFDDRPKPQHDNPAGDWEWIDPMLEKLVAYYKSQDNGEVTEDSLARKLFHIVVELLSNNWDTIELIAMRLQEQQTIKEDELQEIFS